MTLRRTSITLKTHIGPVIDHHSIVRDNGHHIDWETFPSANYGRTNGDGKVEKVIPDACPAYVVYNKVRKADVLVSVEAANAGLDAATYDDSVTTYVTAVIGPVEEFNRNVAINGCGVMRRAGLYENLLHGADSTTGKLATGLRQAMIAAGFYFATYRDIRNVNP